MLNELQRPTLTMSLDVEIPEVPVLNHNMGKVEEFSKDSKNMMISVSGSPFIYVASNT